MINLIIAGAFMMGWLIPEILVAVGKGKVTNPKVERDDIVDYKTKEIIVVGYDPEKNTEFDHEAMTDLENEAIRVVQTLDNFYHGKHDGKPVKVQLTYPIEFIYE